MNKSETPLVNVIVPVYNAEKYIDECIDSLLKQTYNNFKIICVDDGSTDNSLKILKSYSHKNKLIRIYTKNNGGVSSCRNFALNHISLDDNSFIMFVDSDDFVGPDYIKNYVRVALEHDSDIVCGSNLLFFDLDRTYQPDITNLSVKGTFDNYDVLVLLFGTNKLSSYPFAKLFKSSLFLKQKFDEKISVLEDQDIFYKLIISSKRISLFDDALYYYRQREGSLLSKTKESLNAFSALTVFFRIYEFDFGTLFSKEQTDYLKGIIDELFVWQSLLYIPYIDSKSLCYQDTKTYQKCLSLLTRRFIVKTKTSKKKNKIKKLVCFFFGIRGYIKVSRLIKKL